MIALSPPLRRPLVVTARGYYGAPRPRRNGTHYGLDFAASEGDAVVAAAPGTVARVGFDPSVPDGGHGGGRYVIVGHGGGIETGYMHLESVAAAPGDVVSAGDVVGTAGASGTESGGVHLHFQVKQHGQPVDPTALFAGGGASSNSSSSVLRAGAIAGLAWLGWRALRGRSR